MQMWGKFFGFVIGFMFGRLFGGLLGFWLGHLYDRKVAQLKGIGGNGAQRQALFFNSTFAVMGHIAKASGQVTKTDIKQASMMMDDMRLSGDARRNAQDAFSQGKASDFDLIGCLNTFKMISMGRRDLMQMFIEIQIQAAFADGELHPNEHRILVIVGKELGFSEVHLNELLKRWQTEFKMHRGSEQVSEQDAYEMLGVTESSSDQQVKRAYRKLMNEHHPDKLVAKGLPEQMMQVAKAKAQDIQAAYDRVKTARGMK